MNRFAHYCPRVLLASPEHMKSHCLIWPRIIQACRRMPTTSSPKIQNPYADYDAQHLSEFLTKHGLAKPVPAKFLYSNLGFELLGYALAQRAGVPYAQLVQTEITGPLQIHDTVVTMSPAQRKRLIQGYYASFERADPWDF